MYLGLIGTGNIADTHARAAQAAGLTVAAVLGRRIAQARRICDAHGGTPYESPELFFAHRPLDMVAIATEHRAVYEDFLLAIRTGGRPRCDGREGRRSVSLIRAIYASAAAGSPVDVS